MFPEFQTYWWPLTIGHWSLVLLRSVNENIQKYIHHPHSSPLALTFKPVSLSDPLIIQGRNFGAILWSYFFLSLTSGQAWFIPLLLYLTNPSAWQPWNLSLTWTTAGLWTFLLLRLWSPHHPSIHTSIHTLPMSFLLNILGTLSSMLLENVSLRWKEQSPSQNIWF